MEGSSAPVMGTMEEWAELLQITQLVHGGFPSRLLYSLADQSPKNAVMCVSVAVSITSITVSSCLAGSSQSFPTTQLWLTPAQLSPPGLHG